jgi:hypothetical protein
MREHQGRLNGISTVVYVTQVWILHVFWILKSHLAKCPSDINVNAHIQVTYFTISLSWKEKKLNIIRAIN